MEAAINLLPKQTEAWEVWEDQETTELGYGGAAGGGKTRLGWYLAITIAESYPGSRCAVGRKELKNLKATTLTELWEIFRELGYVKDKDYSYNDNKSVLTFANGSEVLLVDTAFSPQDPEYTSLGGLPLTWAWLDESNETPEKAKSILKTRAGRFNKFKNGRVVSSVPLGDTNFTEIKPFVLETFNPNKGHVHRDYYKPWKAGTLPPYRKFIRALPGDNPHLSARYIENLGRLDKATRERMLNGNFDYDADPQKIMSYDAITDLPTNTLAPYKNKDVKTLIVDVARFGGDKIVLGTFKGLELYSLGIYTYQGTDETVTKARIEAQEESVPFGNILFDEDGIGGGCVDNMKGTKGFSGNSSPTLIWNYIKNGLAKANFTNLRSQCYFELADHVDTHRIAVKIVKFQTNIEGYTLEQALLDLFEELDATKKKDNPSDEAPKAIIAKAEIKDIIGRSPDIADILMMRMFYELKEIEDTTVQNDGPRHAPRVKVNKAR